MIRGVRFFSKVIQCTRRARDSCEGGGVEEKEEESPKEEEEEEEEEKLDERRRRVVLVRGGGGEEEEEEEEEACLLSLSKFEYSEPERAAFSFNQHCCFNPVHWASRKHTFDRLRKAYFVG